MYHGNDNIDDYLRIYGVNFRQKGRVGNKDNLQFYIFLNDHEPPHFHVKTKDGSIDAKFLIKVCSLLGGTRS